MLWFSEIPSYASYENMFAHLPLTYQLIKIIGMSTNATLICVSGYFESLKPLEVILVIYTQSHDIMYEAGQRGQANTLEIDNNGIRS